MGTIWFRLHPNKAVLDEMDNIYMQWFEGTGND